MIVIPPVKYKIHLLAQTLAEVVKFFSFDSAIVVVALAEPKVDLGGIAINDVTIVIPVDIIINFSDIMMEMLMMVSDHWLP